MQHECQSVLVIYCNGIKVPILGLKLLLLGRSELTIHRTTCGVTIDPAARLHRAILTLQLLLYPISPSASRALRHLQPRLRQIVSPSEMVRLQDCRVRAQTKCECNPRPCLARINLQHQSQQCLYHLFVEKVILTRQPQLQLRRRPLQ